MNDSTDYFVGGFVVGVVVTVLLVTWVRDHGRDICDNNLLHTEKCVQVWVPEKSVKEGSK